jgi:hypothetical protein
MTQENWSEAWKEFRKNHYELPSYEKAKDSYKRITCACGWTNDLRVNSGIALGYKIAWQNHFYSMYPEFKSKNPTLDPVESVEIEMCAKCGIPSVCTVEKSWHATSERVESYCLEHSKEFETLPGFKVIYVGKGEMPKSAEVSIENGSSSKIDPVATPVEPKVMNSNAASEGKKYLKWTTYLVLFFAVGGLLSWNDNVQTRNSAIETLQTRNEFVNTCFALTEEDQAVKSGPVGSAERISAVTTFYEKVVETPCVVWGDGTVLKNQFYKVDSSSINWSSLKSAYLHSLQRWNSIEAISLRCADGWQSPSIGKQGACSGHGGVVSGFSESRNSDLAHFLSSGEQIYPSLYTLEEATK